MEPAPALRRIVYLLEAEGAETYRVRAFRRAAQVVAEADPGELRALQAAGRLTALPGVGETTARAVAEALTLGSPSYLTALEARLPAPLLGRPAAIRAGLLGDCHTHSDWSDGGSPIEEMAEAAISQGHQYMVLTDHSPRLTVARGLTAERLRRQLEVVAGLNARLAPFRILTGIEVDILDDGALDQEPELLAELDLVVASVHSKLRMESPAMTARMVRALANPDADVLGHCTGRLLTGRARPESAFDAEAVFAACRQGDKAVEINSRPERQDPPPGLLRRAVELGCLVSIDTDAHAPGQLEWLRQGSLQAAEAGVGDDQIINRWPWERLLSWTAAHSLATPGERS
ncbi:MAG: PHP domain-containing protein [Candidatus Dormibacteria bacterium]